MTKEAGAKSGPVRVWFAAGSVDNNASKPIWQVGQHDIDVDPLTKEQRIALRKKNKVVRQAYRSGVEVSAADLGPTYSLIPDERKPSGPQPFMLFGGLETIVTAETRALLEELDPGPLRFHAIEVLNAARTAPLWKGADLHVMQVLTCRRAVVVAESRALGDPVGKCPDGEALYMVSTSHEMKDAMVVLPPPEGAAEMWLDDRLTGALFVSDRVAKALRAAKLSRG
ncbi:hypothetical protein [Jannaschia aquimarina]|nr:hypothetical protein [Jannaschia aquimarina]